jgi:aspartyl-tRNA(Asn)/glutamyl-tRNA(Gln) amidotransferase subunit B
MSYRPTIGLEIHAELNTKTKMFCQCANAPDEKEPNVHVCPVCLAHPGTLPVPNFEAVKQVLRVGTAIGATLTEFTEFDRKSYFYPDIPKGYQISQYKYPLVQGGSLSGVPITRIHLEEDTARSSHTGEDPTSLVDFNRAGVPLMELVTEPALHDSKTATAFARELQLLLRTLGSSHANLEKGEMRIEANVSVSKTQTPSTAYVEVKNINSFRAVERAIEFEIARQTQLLEQGGSVVKETRGWDENSQKTFPQRLKEEAADYRYFPEPDIPKILRSEIPEFSDKNLKMSLPELPWERRARYSALGMKESETIFIGATYERGVFFDKVIARLSTQVEALPIAVNYFISDLAGLVSKSTEESEEGSFGKVTPETFADLAVMITKKEVSSRGAKDVLAHMVTVGGTPSEVAKEKALLQVHDSEALRGTVLDVLRANPDVVAEFRAGKEEVLQYLLGQSMKETRGAGNPETLRTLLLEEIQRGS